jgi:(S)-citramalyl-CoA lyase
MTNSGPRHLRSWLFSPATHTEYFAKATEVRAGALLIDLEDAVAPSDKERARSTALD